ncbi:transcriptional regulator AraC family [Bacteroides sp. CAG:927]|nr:transcriptional regulator AraC family [Bacteroides sp. CAG:927]
MKEDIKDTLNIKSVCECNRHLRCKTLHPQVSIINFEHPDFDKDAIKFEFYAVLLIENSPDGCCCGRKYYDFSNSTMVFLKPGEIFRMNNTGVLPDKGCLLAFHPDLLYRTSLRNHIKNYSFFSYRKEEALHLSQRETETITSCLENIEEELHHSIDTHTATIFSRHIELMLDYCTRFYERQFITRENQNKTILEELETLFDDYIASGRLRDFRFPTSGYCAMKLGLSEYYLNDLLKFETGMTLDEYLQTNRLEKAKKMLLKAENTPTIVARQLGFVNVQYFSLLFKKITGIAPNEYRYSLRLN